MRQFVVSAAVLVLVAIGVPVASAATASASAPSRSGLDTAWAAVCTRQVPSGDVRVRVIDGLGYVDACVQPNVTGAGSPTPALQHLCTAMGGTYVSHFYAENSAWRQSCFVANVR